MRSRIPFALAVLALLPAAAAFPQAFTEGFDTAIPLPTGWAQQNLSQPAGLQALMFQGNPAVFPAHMGANPNSYIAANFQMGGGLATISAWLFTPQVTLANGATLTFWTRTTTLTGTVFPDRLQVRMSTNGASTNVGATATSVGDFTALLLDINPTYSTTVYPHVFTQFTATVVGVPAPTSGRLAFRYFVENGGPVGANSDYIGIDTVAFTPAPAQVFFRGDFNGDQLTDILWRHETSGQNVAWFMNGPTLTTGTLPDAVRPRGQPLEDGGDPRLQRGQQDRHPVAPRRSRVKTCSGT